MTDIQELIRIVTRHRVRNIDVFDEERRAKKDKFTKLFNGIWKGEFETKAQAAKKVFGDGDSGSNYKTLKSRLKDKLQDTVMHIVPKDGADLDTIKYRCYKELYLAQNLMMQEGDVNAFDLLTNTYRTAHKYLLTDVLYDTCKLLRELHMRAGEPKKVKKYTAETKLHYANLEIIDRCHAIHDALMAAKLKVKGLSGSDFKAAADGLSQLEKNLESIPDFDFHFTFLRTHLLIQRHNREFGNGLNSVVKMGEYIDAHPQFECPAVREEINSHETELLLETGDKRGALEKLEAALLMVKEGENSYFEWLRLQFLIYMQLGEHLQAAETLRIATRHRKFPDQSTVVKEQWAVFEGYLYLYHLKVDPQSEKLPKLTPSFKSKYLIDKFLGVTPLYSKHRRKHNVSLLILQMLLHLKNGRPSGFEERLKALLEYKNRHSLKQKEPRLYQMIRILETFPKSGYSPDNIREAAAKHFHSLGNTTPNLVHGNFRSMEVIPFPLLAELALGLLQKEVK